MNFDTTLKYKAWIYLSALNPCIYEEQAPETELVEFEFYRVDYEAWMRIESLVIEVNDEGREAIATYNFEKLHEVVLRRLLKSWSLPIPLERQDNLFLTDESFKDVMNVHPLILKHFIQKYEDTFFLNDADKKKIELQCMVLFHPDNSKGIPNAHEAVSLYCNLAAFWEKFGLNYFELRKLPYDVFSQLRLVMSHENEMRNKTLNKSKSSAQSKPLKPGSKSHKVSFGGQPPS